MTKIKGSINYIIVVGLFVILYGYEIIRKIYWSYAFLRRNNYWNETTIIDWWDNTMHYSFISFMLLVFAPLWVALFSNLKLYREFNNGLILYEIQRENYRKVILKKIFQVWIKAPIMLLSLSLFVIILACFLPHVEWSSLTSDISNPYRYFFMINIFYVMFSMLAANVGLLVNYRFRNLSISLLVTQLSFTALLISYILVGVIVDFNLETNYEDVFNLYNPSTDFRPVLLLFFSCIISSIFVLNVYLRKEKVVLAIEKSL